MRGSELCSPPPPFSGSLAPAVVLNPQPYEELAAAFFSTLEDDGDVTRDLIFLDYLQTLIASADLDDLRKLSLNKVAQKLWDEAGARMGTHYEKGWLKKSIDPLMTRRFAANATSDEPAAANEAAVDLAVDEGSTTDVCLALTQLCPLLNSATCARWVCCTEGSMRGSERWC